MEVDSVAVFARKLNEYGLKDLAPTFNALSWNSNGSFAYSCGLQLGATDESRFENEVVRRLVVRADANAPTNEELAK